MPGTRDPSRSSGHPREELVQRFPIAWRPLELPLKGLRCVSAGSRNPGNVKLQGSPLGRIKAHDSQTRAIATGKAKPHKEKLLSPLVSLVSRRKQDLSAWHLELPAFH